MTTAPSLFDGATIAEDPSAPERLSKLLDRVRAALGDGQWHTLHELSERCGGSEASVSARLRDLRKERFGAHTVERRRVAEGLFAYRMVA